MHEASSFYGTELFCMEQKFCRGSLLTAVCKLAVCEQVSVKDSLQTIMKE